MKSQDTCDPRRDSARRPRVGGRLRHRCHRPPISPLADEDRKHAATAIEYGLIAALISPHRRHGTASFHGLD